MNPASAPALKVVGDDDVAIDLTPVDLFTQAQAAQAHFTATRKALLMQVLDAIQAANRGADQLRTIKDAVPPGVANDLGIFCDSADAIVQRIAAIVQRGIMD